MYSLIMEYKEISTFLFSMLPISELRGAIPFGVSLGLSPQGAFLWSLIGNLFIVPILLLSISPLFKRLKTLNTLRNFVEKYEQKAMHKYRNLEKYQLIGLMLFVAIPIPTTGVYTGCLIAVLLNIRFIHAFCALSLGVMISGGIVYFLTDRVVSFI